MLAAEEKPRPCSITWRCRWSAAMRRLPGPSGYFRAKVAQEKLIKASAIPYTIVRATQFFEFVGRIADEATSGQTVHAILSVVSADLLGRCRR